MSLTGRKKSKQFHQSFWHPKPKPKGALDNVIEADRIAKGQLFACCFAGCSYQTPTAVMFAVHLQMDHGSEIRILQATLPDLFFNIQAVRREISNRLQVQRDTHVGTTDLEWVITLIDRYLED